MMRETKEALLAWLAFFSSASTLICCTLPILFVLLGLGASLTLLMSTFPLWIKLAENKFWLFLVSGLLLSFTYWMAKKTEQSCPIDPVLAEKCKRMRKWNLFIIRLSIIVWIIGFISAYLAVPLVDALGLNV